MLGDRGIPYTWRHLNSFSGHAFKTTNENGEVFFVKIHVKSMQGVKNFLTEEEAMDAAKNDPDFHIHDLFDAIERKDYPKYVFCAFFILSCSIGRDLLLLVRF